MTDDTNKPENSKIRLVVENNPSQIAVGRARTNDEHQRDVAARELRKLAANLLRVIAGAGDAGRLPHDLRDAFAAWTEFAKVGHNQLATTPDAFELTIDHLFPADKEPQTEEEWRRWAGANPLRDYRDVREWIMRDLRRSVLREVAETIAGNDMQIRRNQQDIEKLLDRLEEALNKYQKDSKRPPKPNSIRQQRANNAIAKHRADKQEKEIADRESARDKMIASLAVHQWTALRAVRSGDPADFESNDAFTFQVLGSMKLLKRKPGGGKSKRDWELTDLAVLALSRDPIAN
jgi:hypothetical protein